MSRIVRRQTAVGNAELSVLEAGDGAPIVLLHGLPTGAELWRDVLCLLAAAGLTGLAPDLPGYGHTRQPEDADHSPGGAADLVATWLRSERLSRVWVVGHDVGGAVAQLLAVREPGLVARLTLTNSVADGSWPAPRARFARSASRVHLYRAVAAAGLVPSPITDRAIRRAFADPRRAAAVDTRRVLWDGKVTDPAGRAAFERHLAAISTRDTAEAAAGLPDLRMPHQLVWGMADPFQPWRVAGRQLAELLPSPAVTWLDDCGHFTPLECPRQLVSCLLAWREATR